MLKLVLYQASMCEPCRKAKAFLKRRGIEYELRNMAEYGADCLKDQRLLAADSRYCLTRKGLGVDATPVLVSITLQEILLDADDWEKELARDEENTEG